MPAILATGDGGSRLLRRTAGFTLIELLVALAIMVLIASAVPMALGRVMPGRRVSVAADQLVSDLRWLQGEAIRSGTPARLTLRPDGYRLETGANSRFIVLPTTTRIQVLAPADERQLDQLSMFPDGTATPARLSVSDSDRRVELQLSMLTGRPSRL
jgi:type II secretion system protein H